MRLFVLAILILFLPGIASAEDMIRKTFHYSHGTESVYYRNNSVIAREMFNTDGIKVTGDKVPNGLVIEFDDAGNVMNEIVFKGGKPTQITNMSYHKNGKLRTAYVSKNYEWINQKEYYENGQLQIVKSYRAGDLSLVKEYYDTGVLKKEIRYKEGLPHGVSKQFYKSNKLKSKITYKSGVVIDKKEYDEDGQLLVEEY